MCSRDPVFQGAAFRATLEDVIEADILLHVRDISGTESEAESTDVQGVLRDLGIDPNDTNRLIEVWNKADLVEPEERHRLLNASERQGGHGPVLISAVSGEGLDRLLERIEQRLSAGHATFEVAVAPEDGQGLAWLHENTEVLERQIEETGGTVAEVRVAAGKEPRFLSRFPQARRL